MPRRPSLHFVLLAVILQAVTASCTSSSPDEVKEPPRCGSEFPCIDEIVNLETESLQIRADITGELVALDNGSSCNEPGQATVLNAAVTHFEIFLDNKQIGFLSRSIS